MITQVRWHQWETNSSSVHELVISDEGTVKIPESVKIYTGDYGWGIDVLRSIEDRLSYIVTMIARTSVSPEDFKEKYSKLISFLIWHGVSVEDSTTQDDENSSDPLFRTRYLNKSEVAGYIDHQAVYDNLETIINMLDDWGTLYDFVFNGKSMVLIGNDNDDFKFDVEKLQETEEW